MSWAQGSVPKMSLGSSQRPRRTSPRSTSPNRRPLPAGRQAQRQRRHRRVQRPPLHREQGRVRGLHRGPELRPASRRTASSCSTTAPRRSTSTRSISRPASGSTRSTRSFPPARTTSCALARAVDGAGGSDAFALDDKAYALLPARKKQKVLMVTEDNLFLEGALLVFDDSIRRKCRPTSTRRARRSRRHRRRDLRRLHARVAAEPPTSLLFFHPTGENSPFAIRGELSDPRITEVDEGHPVMRWVTMSDVYMDKTTCSRSIPRRANPRSRTWCATRDRRAARRQAQDRRVRVLAAGPRPR